MGKAEILVVRPRQASPLAPARPPVTNAVNTEGLGSISRPFSSLPLVLNGRSMPLFPLRNHLVGSKYLKK